MRRETDPNTSSASTSSIEKKVYFMFISSSGFLVKSDGLPVSRSVISESEGEFGSKVELEHSEFVLLFARKSGLEVDLESPDGESTDPLCLQNIITFCIS